MQTLFFFFTNLVLSVFVVKLIATSLSASRQDWLSSVIATVLSFVVLTAISYLVEGQLNDPLLLVLVTVVVSILLVGFVLESILDTTFAKGMVIASGSILAQWILKFIFGKFGVKTDMLSFILAMIS